MKKITLLLMLIASSVFGQLSPRSLDLPVSVGDNSGLVTLTGQYVIQPDFLSHVRDFHESLISLGSLNNEAASYEVNISSILFTGDFHSRIFAGDTLLLRNNPHYLWARVSAVGGNSNTTIVDLDFDGDIQQEPAVTPSTFVYKYTSAVASETVAPIPTGVTASYNRIESKVTLTWDERLDVTALELVAGGVPRRIDAEHFEGSSYSFYYGGFNPDSRVGYNDAFVVGLVGPDGSISDQTFTSLARMSGGTRIVRYRVIDGLDDFDTRIRVQYTIGNGPESFSDADALRLFMERDVHGRVSLGRSSNLKNGLSYESLYSLTAARDDESRPQQHVDRGNMVLYFEDDSQPGNQVWRRDLYSTGSTRFQSGVYLKYDSATKGPFRSRPNNNKFFRGWVFDVDSSHMTIDLDTDDDIQYTIDATDSSGNVHRVGYRYERYSSGIGLPRNTVRVQVKLVERGSSNHLRVNGTNQVVTVLDLRRQSGSATNWSNSVFVEDGFQVEANYTCENCEFVE